MGDEEHRGERRENPRIIFGESSCFLDWMKMIAGCNAMTRVMEAAQKSGEITVFIEARLTIDQENR